MTRANDILQLLLARRPDRLILERRTGLPYGWGIWLRSLPALARPFNDGDVVAQMLQRPPAASGGVAPMLPQQAGEPRLELRLVTANLQQSDDARVLRAWLDEQPADLVQIGRASCRERV